MENIIDIIYFFAAIAVAAVFIYVMVKSFLRWTEKADSPVITVKAAVSGKRIGETANVSGKSKAANEFFVTFANSQGIEKVLKTTASEYNELTVGVRGTLTYRGDIMLSFEAAPGSQDENEVEK